MEFPSPEQLSKTHYYGKINKMKPKKNKRLFAAKNVSKEIPRSLRDFVPSSGSSYNPDENSHQKALATAVSHIVREENKQKILLKKIGKIRKSKGDVLQMKSLKSLLNSTDNEKKKEDDSDDDDTSEEDDEINPQRLSRWQRIRLRGKRNSALLRRARMRKIENEARIAAAGGRVGKLHKPVEITPEKIARRMRKKLARKNKKDAKQLGRHKFQDKPDEVLLSEELPKTLRHLATSSLPLLDYQHSLEANGYIEPKHVDRVKKTKKVLHSQNTAVADFLKDQGVDV